MASFLHALLPGLLWMDIALLAAIAGIFLIASMRTSKKDLRPLFGFSFLITTEIYLIYWLLHYIAPSELLASSAVQLVFGAGILLLPYCFWMFSLSVFDDEFRPGRLHLAVLLGRFLLVAVTLPGRLPEHPFLFLESSGKSDDLLYLFPNILYSLALIFHSLLVAHRGQRDDLVELRLDLRRIFVLLIGLLIAWIIASLFILRPLQADLPVSLINATMTLLLSLAFLWLAIRLHPDILPLELKEKVGYRPDPALKERLLEALEKDRIYRQEGLTIGELARTLSVQEYRLRRLINGEMGFRNFNDLLNRYRIQEACELLDRPDLPIIRIATDIGYPSPGPFNRAFRTLTGQTPTEYRQRKKE